MAENPVMLRLKELEALEKIGEQAWRLHDKPDAGLWELRTRQAAHTYSAAMCWAACDRLANAAEVARQAGVAPERIVIDPGIGFAKHPSHSYGLLARLAELSQRLQRPVLAGPSRKSFMRVALSERPPAERDWGTAAAVTAAEPEPGPRPPSHTLLPVRNSTQVGKPLLCPLPQ